MNRFTAFLMLATVFSCTFLRSQSFSPLFAPLTTGNVLDWVCLDQNDQPIPYSAFEFSPGYWTYTNAHFHESNTHPSSTINPNFGYDSTGQGYIHTEVSTTRVGQAEYIDSTCWDPYNDRIDGSFNFGVGFGNIYWNDDHGIWQLTGGNTTNHGDDTYNHWMTDNAAYGIYYTTQKYQWIHPEQGLVAANDQGLPYGGIFDIHNRWDQDSAHVAHDWGTAADIRGNGGQNGIPQDNNYYDQYQFLSYCLDFQAVEVLLEAIGSQNQHLHCRWPF